ncbi:MAG: hypothetical protein IJ660_01260 [Alphaproteobacteria bacterium]|nr:hypothetical protein [Alphaproteobacteria bacterium]
MARNKINKNIKKYIIIIITTFIITWLAAPLYSNYRLDIENTSPVMAKLEIKALEQKNKIINETNDKLINVYSCSAKAKNCLVFSKQIFVKQSVLEIKFHPTETGQIVLTLKIEEPQGHSTIKLAYKNLTINGKLVFSNKKIGHASPYYYKFNANHNEYISIKTNIKQHYKIKFDIFISVIILAYLLSYKIIQYLSLFIIIDNYSCLDLVFTAIFIGLLFLPMSNISKVQKSVEENRMLAQPPSLFVDKMLNNEYGKQFEAWFNDRFLGRSLLLKLFKNKANAKENENVIEGLDNWIFYKQENSIRNFQNLDLFSEEELESIGNYLQSIQKWCEKNGKKFYFIIPADKNKIYGEFFPKRIKKINPDSQSRANQLVDYIHHNYPEIKLLYLQNALLENKNKGFLYWKNDTHWNDFGAYIGYLELMKMIQKDYPKIKISQETFSQEKTFPGMMMGLGDEKIYDEITYKSTNKACNCYKIKSSEVYKAHECYNSTNKLNMFLLRDSFSGEPEGKGRGLLPYLYESFAKVQIKWRYAINYNDINELKESDVIVLEVIERHLPDLRNLTFPKD